ncbi:bifunctional glutamate N-acetyltransferase/amino-acid acetyltransferase ArgJ [Alphaproteobacteria bacterium]|nr:bifunctional glutamate N-acetyltransferase/amino-acid acetyltransferase ArgJ [Alphaproteobacteria bacterium]
MITKFLSNLYGCSENEVFSSSTGIIGEELNPSIIISCIKTKKPTFMNSIEEAARSIMTTDTFPKYAISKVKYKNFEVNVFGIAKGSGMIAPNMGTMLAYIFTDLNISSKVLQKILANENEKTFNSITVDSDTSTNDTCLLISTNQLKNEKVNNFSDKFLNNFKQCISNIMLELAKQIVIDGEGAKKIITISVEKAKSITSAKKIAFSVANSPLVKTAIAGEDANWGRIVMAIGKSYEQVDPNKIKIKFGKYLVTNNGMKYSKYSEKNLSYYLKNKEINISIDIGMGKHKWTVYTCDLTEQYIQINADYRS